MSDVRPATDRVLRGDVLRVLAGPYCGTPGFMVGHVPVAPPTDEEIDRLARCLWVHDGLPAGMFEKPSSIAQFVNPHTHAQKTAHEMVALYRSSAAKMLVVLQQGGNFDAE